MTAVWSSEREIRNTKRNVGGSQSETEPMSTPGPTPISRTPIESPHELANLALEQIGLSSLNETTDVSLQLWRLLKANGHRASQGTVTAAVEHIRKRILEFRGRRAGIDLRNLTPKSIAAAVRKTLPNRSLLSSANRELLVWTWLKAHQLSKDVPPRVVHEAAKLLKETTRAQRPGNPGSNHSNGGMR